MKFCYVSFANFRCLSANSIFFSYQYLCSDLGAHISVILQTLSFLKRSKEETAGFAARIHTAVDAHAVELLETAAVELQHLEAWGDVPDVGEGDVGELTAPLGGDADAAAEGHDGVAQALAAVEALVKVGPDTVHGVGALRLGQHIFETHLQ